MARYFFRPLPLTYIFCLRYATIITMNQKKVSISILMPVHNVEKYLHASVMSLINSDFSNFEILILDDASTDKTLEVATTLSSSDGRIHVFHNNTNLGVGKSLNKLLPKVKGKYFTRLDGDDTVHPERLSKQFAVMEKGEYGCCGTNLSFMDQKGNLFDENRYAYYKAPARFTAAFMNPIPNATLMYRTDIVQKNRLKFPELKVAEDYSFFIQYLKFSDACMINEPLYHYRMLDNSLSHVHPELALTKGEEFCRAYMRKISPTFAKTNIYNFLTAFNSKPEYDTSISENLSEASKKVVADFKKYYNFSDHEERECYLFLERLALDRALFYRDYYELTNLSLLRRILRHYRLFGPTKTVKKAFKKITKPSKSQT